MSPINWNEVNKRILVIGRFSKEGSIEPKRIEKSFINEIKPVYYQGYKQEAIKFVDNADEKKYFGGYEYNSAFDNLKRQLGTCVEFKEDDTLLQSEPDNGKKGVAYFIGIGKNSYTELWEMLKLYRTILAKENWTEGMLESLRAKLTNDFENDENIRSNITEIFKTNEPQIRQFLFKASTELKIDLDNKKFVDMVKNFKEEKLEEISKNFKEKKFEEILKNFKDLPEDQSYSVFFALQKTLSDFFLHPLNVPAIILWLFSLKSNGKSISDKDTLQKAAGDMFNSEKNLVVDYQGKTGETMNNLVAIKSDTQNETTPLKEVFYRYVVEDKMLAKLKPNADYRKGQFLDSLDKHFVNTTLLLSEEGKFIVEKIEMILDDLDKPEIKNLFKDYWVKENIPIPEEYSRKLAESFGGTAEDWDKVTSNIAEQMRFFIDKLKTKCKETVDEVVDNNYQKMVGLTVEQEIVYKVLLKTNLPILCINYNNDFLQRHDATKTILFGSLDKESENIKCPLKEEAKKIGQKFVSKYVEICNKKGIEFQDTNPKYEYEYVTEENRGEILLLQQELLTENGQGIEESNTEMPIPTDTVSQIDENRMTELVFAAAKRVPNKGHKGNVVIRKKNGNEVVQLEPTEQKNLNALFIKTNTALQIAIQPTDTIKNVKNNRSLLIAKEDLAEKIIPILAGELMALLPDDVTGFGKQHVSQGFPILWEMLKTYGNPEQGNFDKADKIQFSEFFPVGNSEDMETIASYYFQRCKKTESLKEYGKRIRDLEALSKSGADVWVIDATLDEYCNSKNRKFWETVIYDIHTVYVTKDAGNTAKLNKYLSARLNQIRYRPLVFFENAKLSLLPSTFPSFNIGNIQDDINDETNNRYCNFRSGPEIEPVLMLAAATLDLSTEVLAGGKCEYTYEYPGNIFGLAGIGASFDVDITKTFMDLYKQLWYLDAKLAKKFIRTRLDNIAIRGHVDKRNPSFYFSSTNQWGEQKEAFRAIEKIAELFANDNIHVTFDGAGISDIGTQNVIGVLNPLVTTVPWKMHDKAKPQDPCDL
jgi:hypothetical protein